MGRNRSSCLEVSVETLFTGGMYVKSWSFIIQGVSSILFVVLVFMYFIGSWEAGPIIRNLFFFIMIASVFGFGITTNKRVSKS